MAVMVIPVHTTTASLQLSYSIIDEERISEDTIRNSSPWKQSVLTGLLEMAKIEHNFPRRQIESETRWRAILE
ncbi:hypothetical protein ACF0H5_010226 [Mactra antiquata]